MSYNIPPRFDTFLKDKKKPWMYKLLLKAWPSRYCKNISGKTCTLRLFEIKCI